MESEHDNLWAALARTERDPEGAEVGMRLLGSLWRLWDRRDYGIEGLQYLKRALERPEAQQPTPVHAKALNAAGVLAYHRAIMRRRKRC